MHPTEERKKDTAIAIVSFPYAAPSVSDFLSNITTILLSLSKEVHVIAGKIDAQEASKHTLRMRMKGYEKQRETDRLPRLNWLARFFVIQIEMLFRTLLLPRKVDTVIFFPGANYIGPLLASRARGMKSIIIPGGSVADSVSSYPRLARAFISLSEKIAYLMANRVALKSSAECASFKSRFQSISDRFVSGAARYVDFTRFEYVAHYGKVDSSSEFRLLFIGRMTCGKGAQTLLEAALSAFDRNSCLTLCFAGDGPLKSDLERLAAGSKHSNRITFKGWIPHQEVSKVLAQSSLLVLPSESEGQPTTLLESMAAGVVVLATPVGGIPEMIEDGITGFIIRSTEPRELAEQMLEIAETKDLSTIAENATRYIEKEFCFPASVERFHRILEL